MKLKELMLMSASARCLRGIRRDSRKVTRRRPSRLRRGLLYAGFARRKTFSNRKDKIKSDDKESHT